MNHYSDSRDPRQSAPDTPAATQRGRHLTEEEVIDYALHKLHPAACDDVREHLRACPGCNRRMNHLLDQTKRWEGSAGRKRLAQVRDGFLREAHLAAGLGREEAEARAAAVLADIQRRTQHRAIEAAAAETATATGVEGHRPD